MVLSRYWQPYTRASWCQPPRAISSMKVARYSLARLSMTLTMTGAIWWWYRWVCVLLQRSQLHKKLATIVIGGWMFFTHFAWGRQKKRIALINYNAHGNKRGIELRENGKSVRLVRRMKLECNNNNTTLFTNKICCWNIVIIDYFIGYVLPPMEIAIRMYSVGL